MIAPPDRAERAAPHELSAPRRASGTSGSRAATSARTPSGGLTGHQRNRIRGSIQANVRSTMKFTTMNVVATRSTSAWVSV